MRYSVKLQWGIAVEMTPAGMLALNSSNLLFNHRGGNSFLRSIGGRIRTTYAPTVLEPTDIFHHALSKLLKTLKFTGRKLPYSIDPLIFGTPCKLNIKFDLFGNVLFTNFILDEFEVAEGCDFAKLQLLNDHATLKSLVLQVLAIATTCNRHAKPLASLPRAYPAIRIVSLQEDLTNWQSDMAGLVSRHDMILERVAAAVLEKNAPHQVDHSLLLIDKQGIGAYVPFYATATAQGNLQRFQNAVAMLELAVVLQTQLIKKVKLPPDAEGIILSADEAIAGSVSAQKAWDLISADFKLSTELKHAYPKGPDIPMQRTLIVTVTNVESRAVLAAFAKASGQPATPVIIKDHVYQMLGNVGKFECFLAISEMGAGGISGSQISVQQAIAELEPKTVIMAGIGFGIDKTKQAIGDILVSKQLLMYDLQRMNQNGTVTLRGDRVSASSAPLNWLRHAELNWHTLSDSTIRAGLVLSGDKLVDNVDYRDALKSAAPEAIGGEMEGAGLYVACQQARVDWLLVKAICDWADGEKDQNEKAHQLEAATNAAALVVHLLKSASA